MLNKGVFTKICLLLCLIFGTIKPQSAVTYLDKKHWGGRLGDMLIMYVKAKWVAYQFKLPFLYKPFAYSDQLVMHVKEKHFDPDLLKEYKHQIICKDGATLVATRSELNSLYTIHYYFQYPNWGDYQKKYDSQEIMAWPGVYTNKKFIKELKKKIAPRNPIALPHLPTDKITLAVHIRTGVGFDHPLRSRQLYNLSELNPIATADGKEYSDQYWPFKFPPLQYYVDQIKRFSAMFNDKPIYLFIYTDTHDPISLMKIIQNEVRKSNIVFDCRRENNHHAQNVIEDMFAMAQYQCLIRSGSNFPQISQLIGNHQLIIYPKSCKWIGNTLVIDDAGIYIRD